MLLIRFQPRSSLIYFSCGGPQFIKSIKMLVLAVVNIKKVIKVIIIVAIMTNLSCGESVVDSRLPAPNAGLL